MNAQPTYQRISVPHQGKYYLASPRGGKVTRRFKRATEAELYARKVKARYERLLAHSRAAVPQTE